MAGFRNILVHYYTKVDNKAVFSVMREDVKDILDLVKAVLVFMEKGHAT